MAPRAKTIPEVKTMLIKFPSSKGSSGSRGFLSITSPSGLSTPRANAGNVSVTKLMYKS